MNRTIACIVIALATLAVPVTAAYADEPAPTKEQLDAAKKAFAEGKQLHDAGKLTEAIEKFKESYRLSKNPLLLYNIGFTLDEAGQKDTALFYYRKFLSDAPQNAQQRKTVADRVKVIEQEKLDADLNGTPAPTPPAGTGAVKPETTKPAEHAEAKAIKPAGTYTATDFQHQLIEEAPPGKPLDLTASVPEDSGFAVTLYYRRSGESAFTQKPMKWRYKELVARIPATKVTGDIQYYIEVKDAQGNVVTRSGKATSPNLITMSPGATPRFYPDITDEGEKVSPEQTKRHDEEDPLGGNKTQEHDDAPLGGGGGASTPESPSMPGNGLTDVGSSKFKYAKWGTTATAAGLIGLGVTFYILAKGQASNLENDAKHDIMGNPCTSPCHAFDSAYDQQVQDAGKRDQTISNIGLGVGVGVAVVAGYFWYRELTAKKHGELKVSKSGSPEATWVVAPSIGEGFTGAAAAARF